MIDPRHSIPGLREEGVYHALASSPDGLSSEEANVRLQRFGPNRLREVKRTSLPREFLANFTHLMALLLWAGGIVGFLAGMPQLGIAIWMVNLINGVFSFWQEYQAEKATEALRRILPTFARVVRDGQERRIPAEELVPGDVLLLAEGEHISADGRLVEEARLRVDQSTLTGESRPTSKTSAVVADGALNRAQVSNLVFAGTSVATGTGKAVVLATGMETEFGKIAHLTQSLRESPSPLQLEMRRVTRVVTMLATGIGVLFFVLAVAFAGVDLATGFLFAMGMIVAFVPEGMLPTLSLALAMGVQRMARRNALVKRLSSVETLGRTTVICTDKTGTLTQNEMTVRHLWLAGRQLDVTGTGYALVGEIHWDCEVRSANCEVAAEGQNAPPGQVPLPEVLRRDVPALRADGPPATTSHFALRTSQSRSDDLRQLLVAASLCSNSHLVPPGDDSHRWTILGDPTEAALQVVARKAGLDLDAEARRACRLCELPFDSRRKRMSTVHEAPDGADGCIVYVKGAPGEVLDRSTRIRWEGEERPLGASDREQIAAANDAFARAGLRVLAVAERQLSGLMPEEISETIEQELTFLGLVAMLDPPRPEVAAAVEKCHRAGIRVVMITGDYGLTAESIARGLGIVRGERPRVINGVELETLGEPALHEALKGEVIFARTTPEHKLRVVHALQAMGEVVAVTGDGVNDAPALKKADIGVAMGLSGTDVAKEAADMILTDDNFASIVNAVEEGRAVYANIRKFAVYVFNSNMAEAVPFAVMLFSRGRIPLPLTVMQVLAIDLGTDMVPAIGLGAEPPEAGVMERPPLPLKEPLLHRRLLLRALLWYGAIESLAAMAAYFYGNALHGWPARPLAAEGTTPYRIATTMTLAGVVVTQVGAVLACRTNRTSIFKIGFFSNRLVLLGIAVELILLALLVYVPVLQPVFNTAPLGAREWAFLFAWTPVIFFADEARKAWLRRRAR